jgi:hypothetical protein
VATARQGAGRFGITVECKSEQESLRLKREGTIVAFFVELTVGTGKQAHLINLEQVTYCMAGAKGGGTVVNLADGKQVTVNEDLGVVASQCSDASRRG